MNNDIKLIDVFIRKWERRFKRYGINYTFGRVLFPKVKLYNSNEFKTVKIIIESKLIKRKLERELNKKEYIKNKKVKI